MIEPGIYPDMPEADYHRGPGRDALSKSLLVEVSKSPLHCQNAMDNGSEPTKAMEFGSACHMAILEPERFRAEYVVFSGDRRTKQGKADYDAILKAGQVPLSRSDWENIEGMARAVREHAVCRDLLSEGMPEVSIFWKAKTWEIPCKARCDWLNPHKQTIVDLKTCVDASPGAFARDAARYRYHWQAHWYTTGAEAVLGPGPWRFLFVAVEKAPPYGVAVYELPQEALDVARKACRRLVCEFWHARELKSWPGYSDQIETLNLPRWAMNTEESSYE